jgi:hypothetical protein
MKKILFKAAVLFLAMVTVTTACKKDDDSDDDDPPVAEDINHYTVTGSYGDVITYTIDEVNHTYSYTNETTGATGSGSYTMSTNPNMPGVFEISSGGQTYYTIELADKFMATSMPSGRPENKLCFGVSSDLNLTSYSAADLAGRYVYVVYQDFNDSTDWGGFEVLSNGTFTYNVGTNYVTNWNDAVQFAGAGSGTWAVSGTNNSRIIFTEGGIDYVGSILPGKIMVMDDGVGNGFTMGLKYPDVHPTKDMVAGTYRYIDITTSGEVGIGYYNLPASGSSVSYYYKYNDGTEGSGTAGNYIVVNEVKSMFQADETIGGTLYTSYFIILPGEIMMHYCTDTAQIISYGIGAKIN